MDNPGDDSGLDLGDEGSVEENLNPHAQVGDDNNNDQADDVNNNTTDPQLQQIQQQQLILLQQREHQEHQTTQGRSSEQSIAPNQEDSKEKGKKKKKKKKKNRQASIIGADGTFHRIPKVELENDESKKSVKQNGVHDDSSPSDADSAVEIE